MTVRGEVLEVLREAVRDTRLHIGVGRITQTSLATDRSSFKVELELWPAKQSIVATQTMDAGGANAGVIELAEVGDMVIVAFLDGHEDMAFVLRKLPTKQAPIPVEAATGDQVVRSRAGKKLHLGSDTRINLGLLGGEDEAAEPLVLGLVFQQLMVDFMTHVETIAARVEGIGNAVNAMAAGLDPFLDLAINPATSPFQLASLPIISTAKDDMDDAAGDAASEGAAAKVAGDAIGDLRESPVEDSAVLSDLAFTEKGS